MSPELLYQRLKERSDHFAGPAILPDQLATLEEPTDALAIEADRPVNGLVVRSAPPWRCSVARCEGLRAQASGPGAGRGARPQGSGLSYAQSDTGSVGSIHSQQSAPPRKSTPVKYSGALQLEKYVTITATSDGLTIDRIWPDVFIAALNAPDLVLPMSMHVPHAAPNRKLEEAPPREISSAAHTGFAMKVPAIVKSPAAANAAPPTPARPLLRPKRLA